MNVFSLYPEADCTVAPIPRDHVNIQKRVNKLTGNFAVLKTYCPRNKAEMREIERECFLSSTKQHPHVIRYYSFLQDPKSYQTTILMDYISGGDLHTYIHGKKQDLSAKGNHFVGDAMWKYVAQLINIVDFLHETLHICHRDLKSQNILLDENGDFVVMDFGHARKIDGTEFETKGLGSPLYQPPEMHKESTQTTHDVSSDYYELGVMIYEMVTGRWPFLPKDLNKDRSILVKEIEELKAGPAPDFSGLPSILSGYVEGLVNKEQQPRHFSYCKMLDDHHIRQVRNHFQPQRPRFVKIAPWSDCDYLIVSDKAPSELLEEVCCLSEKAQVLRVNCDRLCLCAETANAFVQHLMEFIIPGSEVNTNVVFQMVDEDLNDYLYDCWFNFN
ncbi:hypothetical protein GEMRC1_006141 [Eukaryota sp. GEM-RC1]